MIYIKQMYVNEAIAKIVEEDLDTEVYVEFNYNNHDEDDEIQILYTSIDLTGKQLSDLKDALLEQNPSQLIEDLDYLDDYYYETWRDDVG